MKLAIIGTGKIVQEALAALQQVPQIECRAICGRSHSRAKAEQLAAQYQIGTVYTDYTALLQDSTIDFVYIGVINSVHYEYTKAALLAGKHVILEKPFTARYEEAVELAQLAREKGLYLFEAVTLLHVPNFKEIQAALPQLGPIRMVQGNYSQYSSRYEQYQQGTVLPAFDPALYGGALYDINIYNLNFVVGLFGAPHAVHYYPNVGFNGIDTSGCVTMRYDGFQAVCIGAKDSASPGHLIIQGEKGYIRVNGAPNELATFEISLDGIVEVKQYNQYRHRMVHEFIEFAAIYEKRDYARMLVGLEISQAVMHTVAQAVQSAGLVYGKHD